MTVLLGEFDRECDGVAGFERWDDTLGLAQFAERGQAGLAVAQLLERRGQFRERFFERFRDVSATERLELSG